MWYSFTPNSCRWHRILFALISFPAAGDEYLQEAGSHGTTTKFEGWSQEWRGSMKPEHQPAILIFSVLFVKSAICAIPCQLFLQILQFVKSMRNSIFLPIQNNQRGFCLKFNSSKLVSVSSICANCDLHVRNSLCLFLWPSIENQKEWIKFTSGEEIVCSGCLFFWAVVQVFLLILFGSCPCEKCFSSLANIWITIHFASCGPCFC